MKKMKAKDQEQDLILDDIITGIKGVREKVKNINAKQDEVHDKTGKAVKKADGL